MVWIVRSPGRWMLKMRSAVPGLVARSCATCVPGRPTVRGHCAPGLVAGRYQPLADDVTIAGDVRPNLASAVDSEDEAKRTRTGTASLRRLRRSVPPPPRFR